MIKNLYINIYDLTDFTWYGLIEEVESLSLKLSFSDILNSELKVSKNAQSLNELKIGRLLVFNGQLDNACVIEDMQTTLQDNTWTFTLIPLKAVMNYRIVVDYGHVWTQQQQGLIMQQLVAYQTIAGNTAGANQNRMFPNMNTDLLTVGDLIDYKEDWQPLGDTLSKLAKAGSGYPLGWNIRISPDYTKYWYNHKQATNRTINQTAVNPVIFSEEFGNISNATYTEAFKDYKNIAYLGNNHTEVWNGTDNTLTGFLRREIELSSTQAGTTSPTTAQITAEGQAQLRNRPKAINFTAEIIDNENTMSTFNEDWFLGDIVTVQSKAIKKDELISIDVQVTEIEQIYANGEYSINATFGEGKLTLVQLIKNAINQK